MSDKKIFQIPAEITKIITMANKSVRLYVDTQENIKAQDVEQLMDCFEKFGWFTFLVNQKIQPEDVLNLPEVKDETDLKSPSQRLRAVLFLVWEHKGAQGDFNSYYRDIMEKLISQYKEKLT